MVELLALQVKAPELVARAEAEGDVRAAVVALKEARERVESRVRIGAELLAPASNLTSIRVEYCEPRAIADLARLARDAPDLSRLTDDELRTAATLARKVRSGPEEGACS